LVFGVAFASRPGERRCFLRADSDIAIVAMTVQQHAK
jgi:hypothetical protein